jgi:hypothetical protein
MGSPGNVRGSLLNKKDNRVRSALTWQALALFICSFNHH